MALNPVSVQTLQRLPLYLNYLRSLSDDGPLNISSSVIAGALGLNDVQVRKDLASVSDGGRPKIGYIVKSLVRDIEEYLGDNNAQSAVIVGAGRLGRALLSYEGFSSFGMDIIMAFDIDKEIIGASVNGKKVFSADRLRDLCRRMKIKIGVITVPAPAAQKVCDELTQSGVLAIWNFAPLHLYVPGGVIVRNENLACSLAVLSKGLTEKKESR